MTPAVRHDWWQYERDNAKARDAYQRDPYAAWLLRRYWGERVEREGRAS